MTTNAMRGPKYANIIHDVLVAPPLTLVSLYAGHCFSVYIVFIAHISSQETVFNRLGSPAIVIEKSENTNSFFYDKRFACSGYVRIISNMEQLLNYQHYSWLYYVHNFFTLQKTMIFQTDEMNSSEWKVVVKSYHICFHYFHCLGI